MSRDSQDPFPHSTKNKVREQTGMTLHSMEVKQTEADFRFFERLMRHDSYCKVRGKTRQQGWGR